MNSRSQYVDDFVIYWEGYGYLASLTRGAVKWDFRPFRKDAVGFESSDDAWAFVGQHWPTKTKFIRVVGRSFNDRRG